METKIHSVLVADAVDEACMQLLRDNHIPVTVRVKMTKEQLIQEIQHHEGLIVRSDTRVTADVLAAAPQLKVVGRAGTGVDNIDLEAATNRGVIVLNTPGGNSISACELTCTLIASLARHVAPASAALKQGSWERKQYAGNELFGKTLAVLGLGRIGREVATRMQAFGMKTIGYDPVISSEAALEFAVEKLELDDIWARADYITVHTPLIPQTRNLINAGVLARCRRGVRIVNVARGGIVDEAALLVALQSGQCGGAALDVFTEEPPRSAPLLELLAHPRVLATPHLGASTAEAQARVAVEVAEQFVALHQGKAVNGVVNAPVLTTALDPRHAPWLRLAQHLGVLASAQLSNKQPPSAVHVELLGEAGTGLSTLGTAALLGAMNQHGAVNLISVTEVARQAGVAVTTEHVAEIPTTLAGVLQGAQSVLRVAVTSGKDTRHAVVGTVREGGPLLLGLDQGIFAPRGVELRGNIIILSVTSLQTGLAPTLGVLVASGVHPQGVWTTSHPGSSQGHVAVLVAQPLAGCGALPPGVTLLLQHNFK